MEIIMSDNNKKIEEKACQWLVINEGDLVTNNHRQDFQKWLAEDNAHQKAYKKIQNISNDVDILSGLHKAIPETFSEELNHIIHSYAPVKKNRFWDMAQKISAVAAVIALSILGLNYNQIALRFNDNYYATDYASHREITLKDGSNIHLNSNSSMLVEFIGDKRHVQLLKGEAYFDIAKDINRPFTVATKKGIVTVVGTEFNINQRHNSVHLSVFEGTVKVKEKQLTSPEYKLIVGQHIRLAKQQPKVMTLNPDASYKITSWKQNILHFDGMKLSEVITELNHYTSSKIIIADASVGMIEAGGVFNTQHVDRYLDAIEMALPIKIVRVTPFLTLIFEKG